MCHLSTAKSYDDRRSLLSGYGSQGSPLSDAMRASRMLHSDDVCLEKYTDEEERLFVRSPFDEDHDSGPAEAWRWAHAACTKDHFYFLKEHRGLRQRGYVMWDLIRLLGWDFFALPSQALASERLSSYYPNRLEWAAKRNLQGDSWTERLKIWEKGGRGWWAPGDESRIDWPRR